VLVRSPRASARRASARLASRLVAIVLPLVAATVAAPAAARAQPSDTSRISTRPLFTTSDAWVAGAWVVGTLAMHPFDKSFARRLQTPGAQERKFVRHQATNLRILGAPGTVIIGATMYGAGKAFGNERMADLGLHGTEAILIGLGVTAIGKSVAGRQRPYADVDDPANWGFGRGFKEDKYRSFPSGHSTMGFAAAAAVSAETMRWWPNTRWIIGPAMYGGAALIGVSRMYNNKHWASDVLTGAAIGTFAGLKVVRYSHSHPDNRVDRWLLGARITPTAGGMSMALSVVPTTVLVPRRPR
jgi:membrane-associated phospholipid phosphatase